MPDCFPLRGLPPDPSRVWSRVQNQCSTNTTASEYIYIPYLKKTVPLSQVAYEFDVINKGNILQYKENSSNITKKQRYSQIAKGMWTNRTTTWASQTQTTSLPNTQQLPRIRDTLTCNNGLTNYCIPTSASDVPGPIINLCYNSGIFPTHYPRQRYIMTNSGNKFPVGYKFFTSSRSG